MRKFLDLQYSEYEETLVDIYLPDTDNFTTVVNFHGGGLDHGAKTGASLDIIANLLTGAGYAFASVEYRKYPNAKYPDFLVDGAKATAFVKNYVKDLGSNGKIMIMGQSAGAWMSLMLCMNKEFLANEGIQNEDICGWFIDSAQTTSHFNVLQQEKGLHKLSQRIDEFSPMYYLDENSKFSKMMLVLYDQDMACRYEQNQLFYKAVLAYNPDADIEYRLVSGRHCSAAKQVNEKGETLYADLFLDWAKK